MLQYLTQTLLSTITNSCEISIFPSRNYTESQFTSQKKRASSDPNLREIGERLLHFF